MSVISDDLSRSVGHIVSGKMRVFTQQALDITNGRLVGITKAVKACAREEHVVIDGTTFNWLGREVTRTDDYETLFWILTALRFREIVILADSDGSWL